MEQEHIDVTRAGEGATAAVRGEFDMAATFTIEPALERVLVEPGDRGIELTIAPGPPEVQRVFEVAGLADVLPFA